MKILIIIFILLGIVNLIPQFYIIYPGFKRLEKQQAINELNRAKNLFLKEIKHIDSVCKDWAFWDDTYNYVSTRNKEYEKSNLVFSAFNDIKINIIGIFDSKGNKIWYKFYDFRNDKYITPFDIFTKTEIKNFIKKYPKGISGIYKSHNKFLFISVNPILKSDYSGPPNGNLIMGKFIDSFFIDKLKQETKLDLSIASIHSNKNKISGNYLILSSFLNDIFNKPILEFSIKFKRKISLFAKNVIKIEIISYIILCSIVLFILSILISNLIILPVENIKNFIVKLKKEPLANEKLILKRNDEIRILANAINEFIQRINQQREHLIELNKKLKQDIEKRIKAEKDVLKKQQIIERLKRMESLALLAGGVAHDLNNILSGIIAYPELLLLNNNLSEKQRKIIEKIKNAGEKASKVVSDLLNVTRSIHFESEIIDINELISEFLKSPEFKQILPENKDIKVETNLEKNIYKIKGSKLHLTKALMNLISNAIDAIEKTGEVEISTMNVNLTSSISGFMEIPKGEYAVIKIADTGKGIPQDKIDRIFEPFYTTKVMGKSGTGLGLFIVWNTVKSHNGYIDVKSVENKGTEFILYFPKTDKLKDSDSKFIDEKLIKGNKEKIVVIEDEKEQQQVFFDILSSLNFTPIIFEKGEDAIEYLKTSSAFLIILDLILLKGIDGLTTANEILKINPLQKILVVTGFTDEKMLKKLTKMNIKKILPKPFSIYSLSQAIKEICYDEIS